MFELRRTRVFDEWLVSLADDVAASLITRRLERVYAGHFGDVKSLGGGISEL